MQITRKLVKIQKVEKKRIPLVKILFWLYFALLILEGALRKWVVPALSAPLLIVRDPISIWILWEAIRTHKWPKQYSVVTGVLAVFFLGLSVIQILLDICPWFSVVYGLRSYLLTFPVAFAMSNILSKKDIEKICKAIMIISIPMTAIYFLQYTSPAASWINLGAYEGAEQINYVGLHVRAAGTFSFVTGSISFQSLVAVAVIFALFNSGMVKPWLAYTSLIGVIISIPLVGARTLVFILIAEVFCVILSGFLGVSQLMRTIKLAVPVLAGMLVLNFIPVFNEASGSLATRFSNAEKTQGSTQEEVYRRLVGPYVDWFNNLNRAQPVGVGMGRGAAAITQLMVGRPSFETGEDELSRNIFEMGPACGAFFVVFRVCFASYLLILAVTCARRDRPLALLMAPTVLSEIVFGVLEQPSRQGFLIFGMAIMIAGMKSEFVRNNTDFSAHFKFSNHQRGTHLAAAHWK